MCEPFTLRRAEMTDLPALETVYAAARETMRRSGNPNQWGDRNPATEALAEDIRLGRLRVVEAEGEICGAFSLLTEEEPTYRLIEQGQWLNDAPYVTLHKVASNGKRRGVLAFALRHAESLSDNVRIDTHRDNHIMQHLLEKHGFTRCGVIHLADGSERLAYQKVIA